MSISGIGPINNHSVFNQNNRTKFMSSQNNAGLVQQQQKKQNKMVPLATSAVALASLGVAGVSIAKARNSASALKEIKGSLEALTKSMEKKAESIDTRVGGLEGVINTAKSTAENARNIANEAKGALGREVGSLKGEINAVREAVSHPQVAKTILTRPVEVNGKVMELGNVMHGYGVNDGALTERLRGEATRRILGARKPIELPENAMIRVPTAEFTGFAKTGGLAVVPRELVANLGAVVNNKQKVELIVDTPMYLGQVENTNFFRLEKVAGKVNEFKYISKKGGKDTTMATMRKIDEMHVPITTDTGRAVERVEVFMSDEMRQSVDFADTLSQFDEMTAGKIKESLEGGQNFSTPLVDFIAGKEGTPHKAEVKFKTVMYKNDKFRMDGPVQEGKIKNIYNDQTTAAGETERNVYFNKFMYENLVSSHETADKALRADWIIGNDWHTGALSAMTRLLTPARKAMGMEPEMAEKIANTPITTLMHNFKLQGSVWHSQDKLLNVMFGEHAAKIAENAWMPQKADMPGHLMNGLFAGHSLNPQTMAMSYADDIIFVSKGNFNEAATVEAFGGTNHALAALRGRVGKYSDSRKLEDIGMASGIRPDEIGKFPTAKGITNGCDRVNNILTEAKARKLETDLKLPAGSLKPETEAVKDAYGVHQHNKGVYLRRVVEDVNTAKTTNGANNPMKIRDFEHTDLTGVDENTLVHGMAGRIVDQKGIDNWAEGIMKYYQRGNYDKSNPPVFYLQGIGDESFITKFMEVKGKVREIDPKAADRMVFAGLFSEPGRYDGCKLMSDFSGMPSWDEPCGLVHKEIEYMSGAISIVNKRGGLTDGLSAYQRGKQTGGANSIFVDFMDKETHSYQDALNHNGEKWADAFETAQQWFADKKEFAKGIKNSYEGRFDWLRGKIQEYVEIGKRHGVINETVDSRYV
ncbi:glycogen/starch synthase [bacterium]|nr:glycogen/starch synthase [bacterium]